jgi:glycosyltransferase involved in cell wall biosynthesis
VSPSLTVLIPTRERAQFLGPTITSVLAAASEAERVTGTRTEVLVVDDASEDDGATRSVAERYAVRYHRITEHDGRRDPGVAIATGVQLVDTDCHLLFGDDDAMLPMHISLAMNLVGDGADVVSTSYYLTDSRLVPTREVVLPQPHLGDLARGYSLVNDGAVTRTELVRDLTWDPALTGIMLLPLWVTLALDDRVFAVSTTPSWLYRRHDANISAALSDDDLAIRARVVESLQAQVIARLGHLPDSPHHDAREAKAVQRAKREAAAAAAASPEAVRAHNRWDKRFRRTLARRIAPGRTLD